MGNDGGSIPYRIDLVKTKAKQVKPDEKATWKLIWMLCALSKRPLNQPVVACPLGKLYNKEAIIEYLLDRSCYGDGDQICGHVKSVKDLLNLTLTPNPTLPSSSSPSSSSTPPAPTTSQLLDPSTLPSKSPFVCPLTMKEANGAIPFVVVKGCGCVISETGLRALVDAKGKEDKDLAAMAEAEAVAKAKAEGSGITAVPDTKAETDRTVPCPNCSKPFVLSQSFPTSAYFSSSPSSSSTSTSSTNNANNSLTSSYNPSNELLSISPLLQLNPKAEIQEKLMENLLAERAAVKAAKAASKASNGGKKRKSDAVALITLLDGNGDVDQAPVEKKSKRNAPQAPQQSHTHISYKVLQELASLEARRSDQNGNAGDQEGMSEAVKSMYTGRNGGKDGKKMDSREAFFGRTFNRYA